MTPIDKTSVTCRRASWIINAGAAIMLTPRSARLQIATPKDTKSAPSNQFNSPDFFISGDENFFCIFLY